MRFRARDMRPGYVYPPVKDTALYGEALKEIQRLERKVADLEAEVGLYRTMLGQTNVKAIDEAGGDW